MSPSFAKPFAKGAAESLRAGVTTIGDISRHCRITRHELARRTPIHVPRIVSFGEVLALGTMRHRLAEMLDAASVPIPGEHPADAYFTPGISPHAPYTVEGTALRAIVRRAVLQRLPLCMHLAELPDEAAFLRDLSGPLALNLMHEFLDHRVPLYAGGPIRWAELHGLLICDPQNPPARDLPVLLAHVNYCDHAEMMQLAAARASVAFCPRTHAFFGHPPHAFREMLECGINVCLATDSLASNPDLSVLKEAQFVYLRQQTLRHTVPGPLTDPLLLFDMITRRGAIALGLDQHVGTLSPNKFADCIILPLQVAPADTATALCHRILVEAPTPTALWLAGQTRLVHCLHWNLGSADFVAPAKMAWKSSGDPKTVV